MKHKTQLVALAFVCLTAFPAQSHAATITAVATEGSIIGTTYLFDGNANIGGGDFTSIGTPKTGSFVRDWSPLNVGAGGTTVTITGLAFGLPGSNNTNGNVLTATVAYLGADGVGGGGDDVTIGSSKGTLDFSTGAGRYEWLFDSPLVSDIDGLNSIFRVTVTSFEADNSGSSFSYRFKTTTGTGAGAVKMDVAGTSVALVPEPSAALLGCLGLLALLRRRRG